MSVESMRLPRRHHSPDVARALRRIVALALVPLFSFAAAASVLAEPVELGRLFYTPSQRAQLEAARADRVTHPADRLPETGPDAPPPLRYDGVLIRSDGKTTRWVDGKPQVGNAAVHGLKPGQIRAYGKVYEPYQVLRPSVPDANPLDARNTP